MKLVALNTWGGRTGQSLLDFFAQRQEIDAFLLQEVFDKGSRLTNFHNNANLQLFEDISRQLPNHRGYFAPAQDNEWGLASFLKKSLPLHDIGDLFIHRHRDAMVNRDGSTVGKNIQYLKLVGHPTIINLHGLWNGQGKTDTADRLAQSKKLIDFSASLTGEFIIAGDFNLLPETMSLKIIEQKLNLVNLITKYGITSTRTSYYQKPLKFADYILVTPGVRVRDFRVLPDEVSDHAALYLDFD